MRAFQKFILSLLILLPGLALGSSVQRLPSQDSMRSIARRSAALTNLQFCFGLEAYFEGLGSILEELGEVPHEIPTCATLTLTAFDLGASVGDIFEAFARGSLPRRIAQNLRVRLENGREDRIGEDWLELWDVLIQIQEERYPKNPA